MLDEYGVYLWWKLTSNDNVLESSGDGAIPFRREYGLVSGLQPSDAVLINEESLVGLVWVVPVPFGELVSCHTEFSALANRNNVSLCVDDLCFSVWHNLANCGETGLNSVGGEGIEAGGRCFCKTYVLSILHFHGIILKNVPTIATGILSHVQFAQ